MRTRHPDSRNSRNSRGFALPTRNNYTRTPGANSRGRVFTLSNANHNANPQRESAAAMQEASLNANCRMNCLPGRWDQYTACPWFIDHMRQRGSVCSAPPCPCRTAHRSTFIKSASRAQLQRHHEFALPGDAQPFPRCLVWLGDSAHSAQQQHPSVRPTRAMGHLVGGHEERRICHGLELSQKSCSHCSIAQLQPHRRKLQRQQRQRASKQLVGRRCFTHGVTLDRLGLRAYLATSRASLLIWCPHESLKSCLLALRTVWSQCGRVRITIHAPHLSARSMRTGVEGASSTVTLCALGFSKWQRLSIAKRPPFTFQNICVQKSLRSYRWRWSSAAPTFVSGFSRAPYWAVGATKTRLIAHWPAWRRRGRQRQRVRAVHKSAGRVILAPRMGCTAHAKLRNPHPHWSALRWSC